MVNLEMSTDLWARQMKDYLGRDLGAFYTHIADRLMLYSFMAGFFTKGGYGKGSI